MKICPQTISLRCVEDADFEPVSLEDAKLYAHISEDDESAMIAAAISAARGQAEGKTRRVLRESTWEWSLRWAWRGALVLPVSPCSACMSVSVDGVEVDADLWSFTPSGSGGMDGPLMAGLLPSDGFPEGQEMMVRVRAGYAEGACPAPIRQWILVRVADFYEQRESFVVGVNFNELSRRFVDALLDPYLIP